MLKSLRAAVVCAALLIFAAAAWAASGDIFALRSGSSDVFRVTSAGDVVPGADNTYDLGTSSLSWQDFTADGTSTLNTVSITGNTTVGNATTDTITVTGQVASDVLPSTDNARDLGSAAKSWNDIYADGTSTLATAAITTGTVTTATLTDTTFTESIKFTRTTTAADYTVVAGGSHLIAVTSTAAARTVNLPTAASAGAGAVVIVKDESDAAFTNNITIEPAGSETIDGAINLAIASNAGVVRLYSDGTNWWTF